MSARGDALSLLALVSVGTLGLIIAVQGWRLRAPDNEVLDAISSAAALVERGRVPERGTPTDLRSFMPPGTAWLAVPGVVLSSDARRIELVGSGALYLGTLLGVFLIGRRYFGDTVAIVAVALYGFSAIAIDMAGHLWPRGHPFFYVWIVYCTSLWIDRRGARYLAAALVIWAAGMYEYIELAPAVFIVVAAWWYYRLALSAPAVLLAALVALAMWAPYLSFESHRGFVDLQSQALMRMVDDTGAAGADECGPFPDTQPHLANRSPDTAGLSASRLAAVPSLALANFGTRVPGGEYLLVILLTVGLGLGTLSEPRPRSVWIGVALGILATEFILRSVALPESRAAQALVQLRSAYGWGLLVWTGVAARRGWQRHVDAGFLSLALMIPWAILLILTEADKPERLMGVWPLQVLFIAAGAVRQFDAEPRLKFRRWAAILMTLAVVSANIHVLHRVRDWRQVGWSGGRADDSPVPVPRLTCE